MSVYANIFFHWQDARSKPIFYFQSVENTKSLDWRRSYKVCTVRNKPLHFHYRSIYLTKTGRKEDPLYTFWLQPPFCSEIGRSGEKNPERIDEIEGLKRLNRSQNAAMFSSFSMQGKQLLSDSLLTVIYQNNLANWSGRTSSPSGLRGKDPNGELVRRQCAKG